MSEQGSHPGIRSPVPGFTRSDSDAAPPPKVGGAAGIVAPSPKRIVLGVCAMVSRDEGVTWDAPRMLFNTDVYKSNTSPQGTDGGYPSSTQLADGTIVTAYYCQRIPTHQRYHMGVVRWRLS